MDEKRRSRKSIAAIILLAGCLLTSCGSRSLMMPESETADLQAEQSMLGESSSIAEEERSTKSVMENTIEENLKEQMKIYVTINDHVISAVLNENSSSEALMKQLSEKDITIEMHDYSNFEKVGSLGFDLPRNDESITAKAGDIILYQGNQIVFYYDTNSWSFTKLGEFQDVSEEELREIFGDGNISATLSVNAN